MINKQLLDFVQKAIEDGHSNEQIMDALAPQGWSQEEISDATLQAKNNIENKNSNPLCASAPKKKEDNLAKLKEISASQILLYIGGIVVVLAGIIYIGTNWSAWGAFGRTLAIFLPMLICMVVGSVLTYKEGHERQGNIFVVVGALLLPFFLTVLFKEFEFFSDPYEDNFVLAVSSITLVAYLCINFVFHLPALTLLYLMVGLVVYQSLWSVLGVSSYLDSPLIAWFFLVLGSAYMVFSLLYENLNKEKEAVYSNVLGGLVVAFSFFRLFVEIYDNINFAWVLFLLGVIYFFYGVFLEKNNFKKYSTVPYLLGAGVIFFSLARLGQGGGILKPFFDINESSKQEMVGWSGFVAGVMFLVIAFLISLLKRIKIDEGVRFKEFFNLVGPIFILGFTMSLGLDGSKPIYETMLLLFSLGFIFVSIPTLSRQYLYMGTFFLVVYIFSIGREYFQNDVGWPLTLFVAGLLSMGIGVGIEKIRRMYFLQDKKLSKIN